MVHPYEPNRKPLVKEWLGEVKKLLIKHGYQHSESFSEYFS